MENPMQFPKDKWPKDLIESKNSDKVMFDPRFRAMPFQQRVDFLQSRINYWDGQAQLFDARAEKWRNRAFFALVIAIICLSITIINR